jgi:hypothetical protein
MVSGGDSKSQFMLVMLSHRFQQCKDDDTIPEMA